MLESRWNGAVALLLAALLVGCGGPAEYTVVDDAATAERCASVCAGAVSVTAIAPADGGTWCYCGCDDGREVHAEYAFDLAGDERLARALWKSFAASCARR